MTVVQPAADRAGIGAPVDEPTRFTAYATGCAGRACDAVDRFLGPVERLLVPELSRISVGRVGPSRSSG